VTDTPHGPLPGRTGMRTKAGVTAWLGYVAARTALAIVQIFPVSWNYRAAKLLAAGWVLLTTRHRDRAIANLEASFGGEYSRAQIEQIAEQCLVHWTMFAMEVVWAPRLLSSTNWTRYVNLANFDEALEILLGGRGAILVTGHYGHFEMTGYLLGCLGFDVVAVMRPLDNVYLNRYVVESRRSHGLELLDKKGAIESSIGLVSAGRPIAFIADQDAGSKGLFVDFFGRPASTYKSIGLLAMRSKVPIIVGYARRTGNRFHYEVGAPRVIHPHEWADKEDPLRWITQAYTQAIEDIVRAGPEQYLWIHRRWKSKPGARKAARRKQRNASLS